MRTTVLCLLGSATIAPFNCSGKSEPAKTVATAPDKSSKATDSKDAATPPGPPLSRRGMEDDPLVPPIDFGNPAVGGLHDFSSAHRARFHAHGEKVCASGCAASRHPTGVLSKAKYRWLLRRFAEQPMNEDSPALENLMYFGRQTTAWMKLLGTEPLDEARVELLERELKKTHAFISFRVVDEHGVVRTHMPPTRVPLDRRHEFNMEVKDLPPLITSGTVKRVGLHHLWTRL